jgi:ribonuclease BN (tRNA processing enzyme)
VSLGSFTVLGSSSGLPQAERACSGYLLQVGESLSLIDCGGGVTSSFLRCGFDPFKLDRVFISHTHSDHVGELTLVIQMLHVLQTGRELQIFLPDEFLTPFWTYLNAVYMIRDRLNLHLDVHGYHDGFVFDGDFKLTAIGNSHHAKARDDAIRLGLPNRLQCHSFRIDVGGRSVFYSADVGGFDDIGDQLKDLDYAIIETTHITVEQLIHHARESTVNKYILTHLGGPDEVSLLREQVAAAGVDKISIAADGMRLELGGVSV